MTTRKKTVRAPAKVAARAKSPSPKASALASKRAAQSERTRTRILDVAEELLGQHGFYGTTIREVARQAEVDTALLHYYFDSKQGLFDAVFERRATIINSERLDALDAYEKRVGKNVEVEGAIEAFLNPILDWIAKGGQGWRNYFAIVAQVNATPVWGTAVMVRYFDPVIQRLIALVQKALPDAEPVDLYWAYHNLSGALTLTLGTTGRIDRLSNGLCRSDDVEALRARMIAYAAAGFHAVCEPQPKKPKKK
ncbi:TetR/AcrR family transcriptional regulator [Roseiterribacter gracilis]|uniref:TetR/AcrR family transcriptional regulator n=1 Tax=Roseiterribacter gracilis TaxID=2812848 RepID=UPI003B437186